MTETVDSFWSKFLSGLYGKSGDGSEYIFRGASDAAHYLIPAIGRDTKQGTHGDISSLENDLINEFKRLTVPILKDQPKSEFEWLFLAQHYGLPTRLLDWSTNPLVALFFAVEKDDEKDGAVYMVNRTVSDQYEYFDYRTADYTEEHKKNKMSVFAIQPKQGVAIFIRPKYTDQRHLNQRSVFSCPKDVFTPLELDGVIKLHIQGLWKSEIRQRLRQLGISASFIYPGLSGVTSELKSLIYNPVASGNMQIMTSVVEIKL